MMRSWWRTSWWRNVCLPVMGWALLPTAVTAVWYGLWLGWDALCHVIYN